MPRMPPEVHKGRERMEMKKISNIKKVEGECAKLCEERKHIWTELVEDPKIKEMEARLRDAKGRPH
jgi:hypothetical protein